jgi:hypothetical protein
MLLNYNKLIKPVIKCFFAFKVIKLIILSTVRCVPQQGLATDLRSSISQRISHALLMCVFLLTPPLSQAQAVTSETKTANLGLTEKIKLFLEPERGLNNEIRAGLARLEQTCTFTNPSKTAAAQFSTSKSAQIPKEIDLARKLANEQQAQADKAIAEYRTVNALNANACAVVPPLLRVTDACARFQKQTDIAQAVTQASQAYVGETLARFNSYESAVELEAKGCTRPEFAHKLWVAEQVHIVPKLKTSGQQLSDLLK